MTGFCLLSACKLVIVNLLTNILLVTSEVSSSACVTPVINSSVVVYVGVPVIVPDDVSVTIDCGHLIDTIPDSKFCISWLKNGNPITTNSSCIKVSVDMRYIMISSDDLCKPGSPKISDSYITFRTDDAYDCKISRAIELDVDEETVNQANAGNEFYLGFFQNRNTIYCAAKNYPPVIWVTTLEATPVSFVITTHDGTLYSGMVCPDSATYVSTALDLIVSESAPVTISERFKGIRIKAEHNGKIIVFGQYEELGSNDAYVALPVVRLPFVMSIEYILVSVYGDYGLTARMRGSVGLIIGTENDTEVTIVPNVVITHNLASFGSFIPGLPKHFNTITIQKYQTLYLQVHGGDISGTRIITNKPVSVFSGHECAKVPVNSHACDMLIEQLPPTYTWGTEVVTIPLATRANDMIKIIASQHSTTVSVTYTDYVTGSVTPISTFSLNSGQFKELTVRDYAMIKSNHPIAVFQISRSGYTDNNLKSDPFMLMVPSRKQYLNSYTITTAPFQHDLEGRIPNLVAYTHYINIAVPVEFFNANQITVNGRATDISAFQPIRFSNSKIWGYGAQLKLEPGIHVVKHLNRKAVLSVVVYGFAYQMSYGYCGGLHYPTISNDATTVQFSSLAYRIEESQRFVQIELLIANPLSTDFSVDIISNDNSATRGADYIFPNSRAIVVPAEVTSVSFNITVIDDHVLEPNESFHLYFSSTLPDNVVEGIISQVQVIIFNDDEPPQILPITIPTAPPGEISITTGIPSVTTVDTGTTVTIYCPSSGIDTPTIVWSKNSMTITSGGRFTISTTQLGTEPVTSVLEIDDFQPGDVGTYTCTSTNRAGEVTGSTKLTQRNELIVIDEGQCIPKPQVIPTGDITVMIGSPAYINDGYDLTLTCKVVHGIPVTISWYRDGVLDSSRGNTSTITIENVDIDKDNGAVYTCRADNDKGYDEQHTTVDVFTPLCSHEICKTRKNNILCIIPDSTCLCKRQMGYCSAAYYSTDTRPIPVTCTQCRNPTDLSCLKSWSSCVKRSDEAAHGRPNRRLRTATNFKIYAHPC